MKCKIDSGLAPTKRRPDVAGSSTSPAALATSEPISRLRREVGVEYLSLLIDPFLLSFVK